MAELCLLMIDRCGVSNLGPIFPVSNSYRSCPSLATLELIQYSIWFDSTHTWSWGKYQHGKLFTCTAPQGGVQLFLHEHSFKLLSRICSIGRLLGQTSLDQDRFITFVTLFFTSFFISVCPCFGFSSGGYDHYLLRDLDVISPKCRHRKTKSPEHLPTPYTVVRQRF